MIWRCYAEWWCVYNPNTNIQYTHTHRHKDMHLHIQSLWHPFAPLEMSWRIFYRKKAFNPLPALMRFTSFHHTQAESQDVVTTSFERSLNTNDTNAEQIWRSIHKKNVVHFSRPRPWVESNPRNHITPTNGASNMMSSRE